MEHDSTPAPDGPQPAMSAAQQKAQSMDLLEATHSFPCKYMFKAIGTVQGDFAIRLVAEVRATLGQDFDPPHELRHTPSGRHVAVTLEPFVQSADEVLLVYEAIRQTSGLVMML